MELPKFNLQIKPGHTTSEFWMIGLTGFIGTLLSMMSLVNATWVVGAMTLLTLGYNASRSKLKTIQAEAEAHVIKASLPAVPDAPTA